MFSIECYVEKILSLLKIHFGERLLYLGLHGSYARGEGTAQSDIDLVVVLDKLTAADMEVYRSILEQSGEKARSCGFICGREELRAWNPLEAWQLLRRTKDCFGCFAELLPPHTRTDEINYVKMSLNDLYHELCHSYIHLERVRSGIILKEAYKAAFFGLQNLHFLESGVFAPNRAELMQRLTGADREIMYTDAMIRSGREYDHREAFERLFAWVQDAMQRVNRL